MSRTAAGAAAQDCPCGQLDARGRPLGFASCCGRFIDHFDRVPAPDAERLMRSRYSAFVRERGDYLQATWHPSTRPAEALRFDPGTRWLGLEVRAHRSIASDRAEVEFVARHRNAGRAVRIAERSRFVREHGRWFYVDGDDLSAGAGAASMPSAAADPNAAAANRRA